MARYPHGASEKTAPPKELSLVLAGNPNVGKSTLFNALTGMRQHTGNWPGKTVASAVGRFTYKGNHFRITDLPGTYSLSARSPEEEITRDQICFGGWDKIVMVADATSLERNLPLVLQVLEITEQVILCVNLMDEAVHRGIQIDLKVLSEKLGIPVVGVTASRKKSLTPLLEALISDECMVSKEDRLEQYPETIRTAFAPIQKMLEESFPCGERRAAWLSVLLLSNNQEMVEKAGRWCGEDLMLDEEISRRSEESAECLAGVGIRRQAVETVLIFHRLQIADELAGEVVHKEAGHKRKTEHRADMLMNNPLVGYPLMALSMVGIFYLTIRGADAPTRWLETGLFWAGDRLSDFLTALECPNLLKEILILGAWRMLAWVISVMMPPMLIFFPLFTILEDLGYLPRVAFALDRPFQHCGACGKQALTMAMGLGCNAVGVTGCRIIDSPRERLLAILTNSFVPCNGRFPMLILIAGLFLTSGSFGTALLLGMLLLLTIWVTMGTTRILSGTILKGNNTPFLLELPPFRRPRLGQILIRSLLDRAGFILGRAAAVAAPAGVLIWVLSNVRTGGIPLLHVLSDALEPLGEAMGMDGAILLAFLLGSAANETVIPIALMIYSATTSLSVSIPPSEIREILLLNGWDWITAVSVLIFAIFHWPCTTTLLTVHKETGSWKWTALAAFLPTICGTALCFALHWIMTIIK